MNLWVKISLAIIGLVLVLPGLVMLGLGIWQYAEARSFVNNSISTQGKVVSLQTVSSGSGVMFSPVFEYRDGDGNKYVKTSDSANYPAKYRAGESVEVLYRADDPTDAKIASTFSIWGIAGILLLIGALFLFFGLVGSLVVILLTRFLLNRFARKPLTP